MKHFDVGDGIIQPFFVGTVELADTSGIFIHETLEAFTHSHGTDTIKIAASEKRSKNPFFFLLQLFFGEMRQFDVIFFDIFYGAACGYLSLYGTSTNEFIGVASGSFSGCKKSWQCCHSVRVDPETAHGVTPKNVRIRTVDFNGLLCYVLSSGSEE